MSGLLLILSCIPALIAGLALGRAANPRRDSAMPRWLPAAALVPGLVPIAWHFRRISNFIEPVPAVTDWSQGARELEMLSLALPFTVVAIWALTVLLVRRLPAAAILFPALATGLYLLGMERAAPHVWEVIDGRSDLLSLLLVAQLPMTAAVTGFLWSALGRGGLFARWPLRAR